MKWFGNYVVGPRNIKIYRTVVLPIVFYECETWSLTLWEEKEAEGV